MKIVGCQTKISPGGQTSLVPPFSDEKTKVPKGQEIGRVTRLARQKVPPVLLTSAPLHKPFCWAKKKNDKSRERNQKSSLRWGRGGWTHKWVRTDEFLRDHSVLSPTLQMRKLRHAGSNIFPEAAHRKPLSQVTSSLGGDRGGHYQHI